MRRPAAARTRSRTAAPSRASLAGSAAERPARSGAMPPGQVVSVVHQHDVSRTDLLQHASRDPLRIGSCACRGCAATRPPGSARFDCAARANGGLLRPIGGRYNGFAWPPVTAAIACAPRSISSTCSRSRRRSSASARWSPRVIAELVAFRDAGAVPAGGCASSDRPMQKKVARAPCFASASSTAGVTSGSGPSSKLSATRLPIARPMGHGRVEDARTRSRDAVGEQREKPAAGIPRLSADSPNAPRRPRWRRRSAQDLQPRA